MAQALSLGALGGCTLASQWDGTKPFTTATGLTLYPPEPWMSLAWDDPTNFPRWEQQFNRGLRGARSDWLNGLAVSAGGKYIACPVGASPLNAMTIVATETGERWRIAHPNRWIEIKQPVFSPDGESIAMVASPPTYGGNCEIWIAPVRGGPARIMRSGARRSMNWPFFSWDGKRIACFRDVLPDAQNTSRRPEYAGYIFGSPFEYEIETGAETRLSELIVGTAAVPHAAYAPNDRDLLAGARILGGVLKAQGSTKEYGKDLPVDCTTAQIGCFEDYGLVQPPAGLLDGREFFELKRGAPAVRFPKSARPKLFGAPGARFGVGSRYYGADRHGRVVISDKMRAHACDEAGPVKTLDLATTPGWPGYPNIEFCAISSDGEAIAASTPQDFTDGGTRVDLLRGDRVSTFVLKPSADGPGNTRLITDEGGKSEFPR